MTAGQIVGREIVPDSPASACAACGKLTLVTTPAGQQINGAGSRHTVSGALIMLCMDAAGCCKRYRAARGAQSPEQFALILNADYVDHAMNGGQKGGAL